LTDNDKRKLPFVNVLDALPELWPPKAQTTSYAHTQVIRNIIIMLFNDHISEIQVQDALCAGHDIDKINQYISIARRLQVAHYERALHRLMARNITPTKASLPDISPELEDALSDSGKLALGLTKEDNQFDDELPTDEKGNHSKDESHKKQCQKCNVSFDNDAQFKEHYLTVHMK
jgi:hypothetical protein